MRRAHKVAHGETGDEPSYIEATTRVTMTAAKTLAAAKTVTKEFRFRCGGDETSCLPWPGRTNIRVTPEVRPNSRVADGLRRGTEPLKKQAVPQRARRDKEQGKNCWLSSLFSICLPFIAG